MKDNHCVRNVAISLGLGSKTVVPCRAVRSKVGICHSLATEDSLQLKCGGVRYLGLLQLTTYQTNGNDADGVSFLCIYSDSPAF